MCPLAHYNKLDQFTGCDVVGGRRYAIQDETYAQSSMRPDWCPLIEIPEPHGDLIDRDVLAERMKHDNPQTSKKKWLRVLAAFAPAVIPETKEVKQ